MIPSLCVFTLMSYLISSKLKTLLGFISFRLDFFTPGLVILLELSN